MSGYPVVPSLHGWHACLALAEPRLAAPGFQLLLRHEFEYLKDPHAKPQHWKLEGRASGLSIEVLRDGWDLVTLRSSLDGTLTVDGKARRFTRATWEIESCFKVADKGRLSRGVVANLGDERGTMSVRPSYACRDLDVQLEEAVGRWTCVHGRDTAVPLFGFDVRAGDRAGARFSRFLVTTAYPEASPGRACMLLLMGDETAPQAGPPPVFDPRLLPQGETAVLWITRATLERTHGMAVAEEAFSRLGALRRRMPVDLGCAGTALGAWTESIVEHVAVREGLRFSSMQTGDFGLLLSATRQSVDG
jgi:hypothetical protein